MRCAQKYRVILGEANNLASALVSGERRLPACCGRQLADRTQLRKNFGLEPFKKRFGKAAEKNRLVAYAPRKFCELSQRRFHTRH